MLFFGLGTLSLLLAYVGIIMPGIPGIPFILLTAFFYIRSSDTMYRWIMKQKVFATVIEQYKKHKTIPLRVKILIVVNFWVSIAVTQIWFIDALYLSIIVYAIGVICSVLFFILVK